MQRIIAKKNMLFVFGQEVMLIPKKKSRLANDAQYTDEDSEHEEPADGVDTENIAASSDRTANYDGQPWMKLGQLWCPKRGVPPPPEKRKTKCNIFILNQCFRALNCLAGACRSFS